jgi:hypothetical protein
MENETQEIKNSVNGAPTAAAKIDSKSLFEQELTNIVGFVIGNSISGLLNTFNRVPPAIVLNIAARIAGVVMASSVRGDLPSILSLRRELKKSFDAGVNSVDASKQIMPPKGTIITPASRQ